MTWPEYPKGTMERVVPAIYATLYPCMVEAARELGYAVALHGSLVRDMDVIAIPWMPDAASTLELATAVRDSIGGVFAPGPPCMKPHGRQVFTILLDGPLFVDLGVMPLRPD